MDKKMISYTPLRAAKLPIAFCYLFAGSLFAQTVDDVKVLQRSTDR